MVAKKDVEAIFPLSPVQEGMLFHSLYAPGTGVYVIQSSWLLRGDLNTSLLEQAWQFAVERHAALRSSFVWERVEKPVQVIRRNVAAPFALRDWRGMPELEQEEALAALLEEDLRQGYELNRAPLLRLILIRLEDDLHRFVWSHHHLISDGWSTPIVLRDVLDGYEARRRGTSLPRTPVRSYRDYIAWLQKQDPSKAEVFWRRYLAGVNAPTPLGIVRRPEGSAHGGRSFDERRLELGAEETERLRVFAATHQLTVNTLFQGTWALLLSRFSGQEDVVFGVTVAGRPTDLPGADSIVGLFINTLPVRVGLSSDRQLIPWLRDLQGSQVELRQLEHTPLVDIQGWSEIPRSLPLFESLLVFENYPLDAVLQSPEVGLRIEDVRSTVYSNYPLALLAVPHPEGLTLRAKFDRERLDGSAAEALLAQFRDLLRQLVTRPEGVLGSFSLLPPEHRSVVPDPAAPLAEPAQEPVPRQIAAWSERTPGAPAVSQDSRSWSYADLLKAARGVAAVLAARGLSQGDVVGVTGPPSFGLIASLLGVFTSGGVLLTLDPALPEERRKLMCEVAGARFLVLVGAGFPDGPPEIRIEVEPGTGRLGAPAAAEGMVRWESRPDDPAYVFFTSGTTGVPKGVLGRHKGLSHFLSWQRDTFGVGPGDRAAQLTGLSFDVLLRDVFLPLVSGATLCLPPEGAAAEPGRLLRWLEAAGITLIHTVPSLVQIWLAAVPEGVSLRTLRGVFFAGEPLAAELVRRWRAAFPGDAWIVNLYGPTETTLAKCFYRVPAEPAPGMQPVGFPLPQSQALVLAPEGRLCGVGEPGEVAIRTPFRSLGYLGLPEENAARFVVNPFSGRDGDRLYLTGDRGRYRADGSLELLGRLDDQIKIRGVRVEPSEVSAVLSRHSEVRASCVLGRRDEKGETSLVAYAVVGKDVTGPALQAWLAQRLPSAMVPSAVVLLERMPLTANGKVDRQRLPEPERAGGGGSFVEPRNPAEELLAVIWSEVLRRDRVGALDNFFELGGHSLLATQVVSRVRSIFGVELPLRSVFEQPVLADLAARIEADRLTAGSMAAPPLQRVARGSAVPLSFAQQRLWFLHQLDPASPVYNLPGALRLGGSLDVEALGGTLDEIVRRHEVLRTTFEARQGEPEPVQVVHPAGPVRVPLVDLEALPLELREEEVRRLAVQEAQRPFDLVRGPLLRVSLIRLTVAEHVALFTLHHIVSDGWSRGVLVREIAAFYPALAAGCPSPLPELPIQYADFALWQREWLTGEVLEELLGYWRRHLARAPAVLELPTDRPRPAVRVGRGGWVPLRLPARVMAGARSLSRRRGSTLFMTLQAAFQVLLARYSGAEAVPVGTVVANRNRAETEGLIGFFVNTLVLLGDLSRDPRFSDVLARTRESLLGAYEHQDLPFEKLVDDLSPERSLSYTPLFQVMLTLQNAPLGELSLPGLSLEALASSPRMAKFDLNVVVSEVGGGLSGDVEYDADLFDVVRVHRLVSHLETLLGAAAADEESPIGSLPLLSPAERWQVCEWNDTAVELPASTIHAGVEAQVGRTPEAVAVVDGVSHLSYGELNRRANRLARWLRRSGVCPEMRVGILVERSCDLVTSLLGTLKAGGAYVSLDPSYPAGRLRVMVEDAGMGAIVVGGGLEERLVELGLGEGIARVCLGPDAGSIAAQSGEDLESLSLPGNLGYVIYTSGSTGRPKGVALQHRGASLLFRWVSETLPAEESAVVLFATSVSFDVSVFEVFFSLSRGSRLVVAQNVLDLPSLAEEGITLVCAVPSAVVELSRLGGVPRSVRTLFLGGEALPRALVEALEAQCPWVRVFNGYGPSEDTTYTTLHALERGGAGTPSIGRPIGNGRMHVLDGEGNPQPSGVPGELCLGGAGLARGYLGRPELTAERFVPDSLSGERGSRLYRTGDLARFLSDGRLEYLGRRDQQVKIRGFRIELGEIEAALLAHPSVAEAAVVVREERPGDRRLVAYVAASGGQGATGDLRAALEERLPDYMIPSGFVVVDALPKTPSGKIDRRTLAASGPAPEWGERGGRPEPVCPRTPLEEILAGIWASVLGVEQVGVEDDFFALGGHSLLATQIVSRVRSTLGVEIPLRQLFETPTVEGLARVLRPAGKRGLAVPPIIPVPRNAYLPLSFAQQRLWLINQLEPESPAYNLPGAVRLTGLLDATLLQRSLREVVRRHESLRTTFSARDGVPFQIVHAEGEVAFSVVDLEGVPGGTSEAQARALAAVESRRPFDLERGPLLRVVLLRFAANDHIFLFTVHHIVSDAWSRAILVRELGVIYQSLSDGLPPSLPELSIQYADFAAWQRRHLSREVLEDQLGYWRRHLAGAPPVLELPADRPRPPVRRGRGGRVAMNLPEELVEAVRRTSRRRGVTPFMTLLAALYTLLHRMTGQPILTVGSPIANRNRSEIEGLIGVLINTLVLRVDVEGRLSFAGLLDRVREAALEGYAHQDLPFEWLVEELQPERNLSHTPLFQVMFVLQNIGRAALHLPGLTLRPLDQERSTAKFDLLLDVTEERRSFTGSLEYSTDLFDATTAERLMVHFEQLLRACVRESERRISSLPLLTPEELCQVLVEWNATDIEVHAGLCIHHLVEAQAARAPRAPAVVRGAERLTYRELNERANRLAHLLMRLGVGPEARVGIFVERSPSLVVSLLAVLKAGGAYVPLDPAYPGDRVGYMVEDAKVRVIVVGAGVEERLPEQARTPGIHLVRLGSDGRALERESATNPDSGVSPENLSHIIYTSGSTGRPKGVAIQHKNAVSMLSWAISELDDEESAVVVLATSISFDVSVLELFFTLGRGSKLVVAENILELPHLPEAGEITMINAVPSALAELLRTERLPGSVVTVNVGGEAVPRWLVDKIYDHGTVRTVRNAYGPSENTSYTTLHPIERWSERIPPLGRPIGNCRMYPLDSHLEPLPIGVPGELYVGGLGVARGYLDRPGMTAERFLPDPFAEQPGARMYRVGDVVRLLPDGQFEFLGRIDHQVKVRGFRIELGEIEEILLMHPGIDEGAVVVREDTPGDKRLVAYLTTAPTSRPEVAELRNLLSEKLPGHMIPSAFVFLDGLPKTPSGKIDRRTLSLGLAPELDARRTEELVAPATPTEELLCEIWADVLGLPRVGAHDNFFSLGGHSLTAVRVVARLGEALGLDLPLRHLFQAPTVASLALVVDELRSGAGLVVAEPAELDLWAEAVLDPAICPGGKSVPAAEKPSAVLLTGATGFLGVHLLADLLAHTRTDVWCLVRGRSLEEARRRLQRALEEHGLWNPVMEARIVPVLGDLSLPLLGLDAERFAELAETVEAIYHNGAWVNLSYPYSVLKATNVLGTQEVLRLAASGSRVKPVHHVSTLSVFFAPEHAGRECIGEDEPLTTGEGSASGYAQSKWVAEKLVEEARARGIPVTVYRFGRISWSTRTGAWNPEDFLCQVVRTCARLGCAPDLDLELDLVPVDFVSRAIVTLSTGEAGAHRTAHLLNSASTRWRDLVDSLRELGMPLHIVPYPEWVRRLQEQASAEDSPLLALAALREAAQEERPARNGRGRPGFGASRSQGALAAAGVSCPQVDRKLLERFFDHAMAAGLFAVQETAATSRPRAR